MSAESREPKTINDTVAVLVLMQDGKLSGTIGGFLIEDILDSLTEEELGALMARIKEHVVMERARMGAGE